MTRSSKITIEVSQQGKFFALEVEKHNIAIVTDRKAADTLEALLRGLIFSQGR